MSLCMWVRAMDTYARVIRIVEPKRSALGSAQGRLSEMEGALAGKQAQLAELEQRVEGLQGQLRGTQEELRSLQFQVCSATQRARRCSAGGGGEAGGRRAGGAPREGRGLESSGRPTYAPAFARSPQPLPSTLPAPSLLLPGHHPCTAGLPNVFPWVPPTPMFRLPAPCPPPPPTPLCPSLLPPLPPGRADPAAPRACREADGGAGRRGRAVAGPERGDRFWHAAAGGGCLPGRSVHQLCGRLQRWVRGRAGGRADKRADGRAGVCVCGRGAWFLCPHWACACVGLCMPARMRGQRVWQRGHGVVRRCQEEQGQAGRLASVVRAATAAAPGEHCPPPHMRRPLAPYACSCSSGQSLPTSACITTGHTPNAPRAQGVYHVPCHEPHPQPTAGPFSCAPPPHTHTHASRQAPTVTS